MDIPTGRQTIVLCAVEAARLTKFRGPSLREIQRALRLPLANSQGALEHLRALEKKGYVVTRPREAYSARLTDAGTRWVRRARREAL